MPPLRRLAFFALSAALMLALAVPTRAADLVGSKDDALIPRYAGSEIVLYDHESYAQFTLAEASVSYDYNTSKFEMNKQLDLKGELSRIGYVVPAGASSLEVFDNYKQALTAAGFKPLYEASGDDIGKDQGDWFGATSKEVSQLFSYSPDGAHYLVGELQSGGQTVDIALYVTQFQQGSTGLDIAKGQTIVDLDIVKSGKEASKMVTVSASEIDKGLTAHGHIAIYGIYFDTDKSDLKPESKSSLDQVARYLADNPTMKIHVVGHTDNVGTLDFNIALSRARAAAVVEALVSSYQIDPSRLNPAGVGFLAPVAPNTTEEGRAKNRRVELIPQ